MFVKGCVFAYVWKFVKVCVCVRVPMSVRVCACLDKRLMYDSVTQHASVFWCQHHIRARDIPSN